MERQGQDRVEQTGRTRRGFASRLITLGMLGVTALLVLAACGPDVDKPYSHISPASPTADDIQSLYKVVFWLSFVVFVGVQFAIIYLALRYRRNEPLQARPPQIHGSRRLEILWTVIPAVVLLMLLIPTVTTIFEHADASEEGEIVVDVVGKQWWWEFQFHEDVAQGGQSLDVVTANEITVPVGREIQFRLQSNNVIHSFWVPRLSGKMDVIPGHVNNLAFTPTEVGEFYGECAEFCGAQHAWMRFKINVVPEDEFYAWVNNWRTAPASSARTEAEGVIKAPDTFAVCLACHRVNGMEGSLVPQGIEAAQNIGPNLTMVACRETIAAGMLQNTPENMALWLRDPGAVKPGNYMADQIGPGRVEFSDEEIAELVDYLYSTAPEAGCNAPEGWTGEGAASGAATDATPPATPETGS